MVVSATSAVAITATAVEVHFGDTAALIKLYPSR